MWFRKPTPPAPRELQPTRIMYGDCYFAEWCDRRDRTPGWEFFRMPEGGYGPVGVGWWMFRVTDEQVRGFLTWIEDKAAVQSRDTNPKTQEDAQGGEK